MISAAFGKIITEFMKPAIMTPAQKMQQNLLKDFGFYTRRIQMNSLKTGKGSSAPGMPPHRHSTRSDIKRTCRFHVDIAKKNVVIGMELGDGKLGGDRAMPGVLEHSGVAEVKAGKGMKRIIVAERPSAGPAFDKAIKAKLPKLIEGGIMREA